MLMDYTFLLDGSTVAAKFIIIPFTKLDRSILTFANICSALKDTWQNSRLMTAVMDRDLTRVQECLRNGARAGAINGNGHTAVGMAAALGETEILHILIGSCENRSPPRNPVVETENVCDTPEGMDDLEWEDEFNDVGEREKCEEDEHSSLYYYYAKTLEATGSILFSFKGIRRKEDPHIADETLMTPLHYAAAFGHLQCLRVLLESGCNVNPVNDDGYTPLHLGTKCSQITLTLLRNGANPNLKSISMRETPLHMAVRNKSTEVVRLILNHGYANIDAVNIDDRTALMCAIRFDAEEIAMILLEHSPRINMQDKKGRTALYYAVTRNKEQLVKRLLRDGARRLPEHFLLHNCVRLNLKEMVELLVLHGDNLYMRDHYGLTPAMTAIICKNVQMLEFLLLMASKLAIRPNSFYYLGSELFLAVENTNDLKEFQPIANILFTYTTATEEEAIETGWKVFTPCSENFCSTPLAHAIRQNKLKIAAFLIKEGMDVNQICIEHDIQQLRQRTEETDVLEFSKLLVKSGFKYPYQRPPYPNSWHSKLIRYEFELYKLCRNPLSLKALARLVIRESLTQNPFGDSKGMTADLFRIKHRESVLQNRIKELGLPKILQTFLYSFPDTDF